MKIVTVLGARPQFVKAAVVSRAIAERGEGAIRELIVHTGQHYDRAMSEIFFDEMRIPQPDYNLEVQGGSHGAMTGRMLERVEEVLLRERPDAVLVYGDTNSTLAGALAAVKLHIPVAHVEAGLRSFNVRMPEEINRILTDRVSDWLFCPTDTAIANLGREGMPAESLRGRQQLLQVGDVMFDATLFYRRIATASDATRHLVEGIGGAFALATLHRAENTDDPVRLQAIIDALNAVAERLPIILPIHPRTRKKMAEFGLAADRLHCIEPVGYFDMLLLLDRCRMVLTDSGGLQKEAYFFAKPCITLRDQTEWVELVAQGGNRLAGADKGQILAALDHFLSAPIDASVPLYGAGDAGDKIVRALAE